MLNNSITCSIAVTYKIFHPFNFYGMYKTTYINHFQSPFRVTFYDHISFNSCLTIYTKSYFIVLSCFIHSLVGFGKLINKWIETGINKDLRTAIRPKRVSFRIFQNEILYLIHGNFLLKFNSAMVLSWECPWARHFRAQTSIGETKESMNNVSCRRDMTEILLKAA